MPVGGDSKENLIFLRVVAHTIAVLYHCTKAKEDFVMGNWDLKGGRREHKMSRLAYIDAFTIEV